MAAPIFQRTVVDTQGNVVAGALVEVRNEATDELAPIFVDRELTDVKANPFTTDSTGFIRFFAAAGDYRIKATFEAEEIIFRFVQLIDTDEFVDLNTAQTLENKTLASPELTNPSYTGTLTGGTGVVNLGSGQLVKGTNGDVGIGTQNPEYRLHIATANVSALGVYRDVDVQTSGPAGTLVELGARVGATFTPGAAIAGGLSDAGAGNFRISTRFNNTLAPRLSITSAGNVGIGTSSPGAKLDINRGSAGLIANFTDGVNANFQIGTSSLLATIGPSADSTAMAFKTSNTERLRITSAGNVGIGTATPDRALVVNGDIGLTDTAGQSFLGFRLKGLGTEYFAGITGTTSAVIHDFTGAAGVSKVTITQGGDLNVSGQVLQQGVPISSGIGVAQTWQNVLSVRSAGTTFTNTTGKPILVHTGQTSFSSRDLTVDGLLVSRSAGNEYTLTAIVPPGSTYRVSAGVTFWFELR